MTPLRALEQQRWDEIIEESRKFLPERMKNPRSRERASTGLTVAVEDNLDEDPDADIVITLK